MKGPDYGALLNIQIERLKFLQYEHSQEGLMGRSMRAKAEKTRLVEIKQRWITRNF